jgi:hypothetical protein
VQALFTQQQARLAENDFKIKALTFELAYCKRVRFGKASEALVGEQRVLFDESVDMDLCATRHPPSRHASAPAVSLCQLNCHASSTAMSRHASSCPAIFACNTPPVHASLSRQGPSHRR